MESKTLILIDGHALAYRSYFALERTHMRTSDNKPTWAVYGFFKALFDLLKKVKPDAIAVSFDCGRDTFRVKEYSEYKANRQAMPDSMREQMQLLMDGVHALGIPIYQMKGYEADDVIGTISEKASELGHKTMILTGDQDSFQLLDKADHVSVLIPSKGDLIEYDREKVHEKIGVWPEQITDYKGLRGDTSDNIPGVKGIGEKTAVKLIEEFGSVENVLAHLEEISSKSLKEKLEADKDMAIMSKYLATIKRDVPIDFDFEHAHLTMPNLEELTDYLREVEFNSFLKQLPSLLTPFNNGITPKIPEELLSPSKQKKKEEEKPAQGQLQLTLGLPEAVKEVNVIPATEENIIDTEEALNNLILTLQKMQVFSFDTETTGVNALTAELVGLSFAWDPQVKVSDEKLHIDDTEIGPVEAAYIPVGHIEGKQLNVPNVLDKLKPILEDKTLYKILQNAKYEINLLKNYNINLNGFVFDTMLASYIKNPTYKHNLKHQALAYLKHEMKSIEELIGKGKSATTMDKIQIPEVAKYACDDAWATVELGKFYSKNIEKDQNRVLYDIEIPLVPVLADMERSGVSLDTEYLKKLSNDIQADSQIVESKIYDYAGEKFNINSPKQVGDILFEKLNLSKRGKTKTKTGYSTSAKVLESLATEHPIVSLLLEYRHLTKLKSTYIDALPELVNPKTGRVHTSFNQTITTTGRLSSSNPNLQNIPIKSELGNKIRAAFVPRDKENYVIFSADYSQIELRLLAHFTQDPALIDAFCNNKDVHADTASKVFGVPLDKVTKDMRRKAKAVNFGIIYGQSSYGLAEGLGITPGEAKKIIDKYFQTYPKIKQYMNNTIAEAYSKGYVTTMFGRKRYLADELSSRNRSIREFGERAAINAPLQGTSADLIKIAMLGLHKELQTSAFESKLILQVHDELVLEVPKKELIIVGDIVRDCMELGQPLSVPLVVDMASGPNWMET
ncbi:MAG: DNA polymerase I [Candidatus Melainabacteria bacterium GWF2_32_7]|nr:MAG: DNA polymerase I [Candidatus Melainabacteria bacterium GWF2_32_7]